MENILLRISNKTAHRVPLQMSIKTVKLAAFTQNKTMKYFVPTSDQNYQSMHILFQPLKSQNDPCEGQNGSFQDCFL